MARKTQREAVPDPVDIHDPASVSGKIPYLMIQAGCLNAAAEVQARIDSTTQSRDEIAQNTVRIANRIYRRFVELSQERRQVRRHIVDVNARVLVDDRVLDCKVMNISLGGAMVSPLLSLHVGVEVGLKISRYKPIRARVAAIGAKQTNLTFLGDEEERTRLQGIIAKVIEASPASAD